MRGYKIVALMSAVGVMTIAGVGNSEVAWFNAKLTDFDTVNDLLGGVPAGSNAIAYWQRTESTQYFAIVGPPNHPPSPVTPCQALGKVYNILLAKFGGTPEANKVLTVWTSRYVQQNCLANVSVDTSTTPATLKGFQPTP